MSVPVVIKPDARDDIDDAYLWYEAQQPGRGDDFVTELRARLAEIGQSPHRFGRVGGRVRAAPLTQSRFIIYYRITPDEISVIAVLHERANPRTWRRRK